MTTAASRSLHELKNEYAAARDEYEQLSKLAEPAPSAQAIILPETLQSRFSEAAVPEEPSPMGAQAGGAAGAAPTAALLTDFSEINSDYIGWITIEGVLDYPVVRGRDNIEYINTTFTGQTNSVGTIFMDSRLEVGFEEAVAILYGHNMGDGSMFAPLHKYSDAAFMAGHPYITITTPAGDTLVYRIFSAVYTDVWDAAYCLDFADGAAAASTFSGAPMGADRFLLLSTCTGSANRDARLLVYASLVV